jgi:hypothetical protein
MHRFRCGGELDGNTAKNRGGYFTPEEVSLMECGALDDFGAGDGVRTRDVQLGKMTVD